MTRHTYFHCFECRRGFYGKENLTHFGDHLLCQACIEKKPKVERVPEWYSFSYINCNGGLAFCSVKIADFPNEEAASAFVLKRKRAKEIRSCTVF